MKTKTGKRIVSKGQYVQASVNQAGGYASSCVQLLLCGVFGLFAVFCGISFLYGSIERVMHPAYKDTFAIWQLEGYGFLFLLSIAVAVGLGRASKASLDRAETIDVGVPFTRANIADLAASDSLVRASTEPLQAQEGVLLRAVAQGVETPPEQLVRASAGVE